jgi:hypothetical protein
VEPQEKQKYKEVEMKMKIKKSFILLIVLIGAILSVSVPIKEVTAQEGDFILTVSPSRSTISGDGVARFSVRITSVNGFSGTVKLEITDLPTRTDFQASYSFQPAILEVGVDADAYSILTITASTRAYRSYYGDSSSLRFDTRRSGYYYSGRVFTVSFTITATSGTITKTNPMELDVVYGTSTFTRGTSDINIDLQPGSIVISGEISEVKRQNLRFLVSVNNIRRGDSYTVTPEFYDPPSGLSVTFNPVSDELTEGSISEFNIDLLMTPEFLEKSGTYRLAVGANVLVPRGGYTYSLRNIFIKKVAILTIVVPPYFTLSANPSILNVFIGGEDQKMEIVVSPISRGLSQPITLGFEGIPSGVVANLEKDILVPKGRESVSTNLVFNAPSTFSSGVFPIRISATTLGIKKYTEASIYLQPSGDYRITTERQMIELVPRGESRSITIQIEPERGFRSTVDLSVTQVPSGVTATLSTNRVTVQSDLSVPVVLTLVASEDVEPGTYSVSVLGDTGFSEKAITMTILVRSGTSEIWPVVLLVVVIIGVVSALSFLIMPRGKHVHVIRQTQIYRNQL